MKMKIKKLSRLVLSLRQSQKNRQMRHKGSFRLGGWLVSPDLDRISQGDQHVNLQPQVMDLLVYLAENYDEVISAEELLSKLWKDRIVTIASVYSSLRQLRAALGDDVKNPTYIKTIPKRGYRLSTKPEPVENGKLQHSHFEPDHGGFQDMTNGRRWRIVTVLMMVLVVVIPVVYFSLPQDPPNSISNTNAALEKSIAVLPFSDMSPEQNHGLYSDGMTEEILNKLARLPAYK